MKTRYLRNKPNCSISFAFTVLLQSMHELYIPHSYYILDILDYWPLLSSYYNYCKRANDHSQAYIQILRKHNNFYIFYFFDELGIGLTIQTFTLK